jgi:hypothetical protein
MTKREKIETSAMRCHQEAGPPPAPSNAQGTVMRGRGLPRYLMIRPDGRNINRPNRFQSRYQTLPTGIP